MTWQIYTVTNNINGKQYVGIATDLKRRWRSHVNGCGGAVRLTASIKHHGKENFLFEHIASAFDQDGAHEIERILIKQYGTKNPLGYNLTDGGEGASGFKPSKEVVKKRIDARKGYRHSEETKKKMSAASIGKPKSAAHIAAMKGKKRNISNETREKFREMISRIRHLAHTPEARAKLSVALKGRKITWGWKSSVTQKGRKRPIELIERQRAAMLGRKQTPEQVAKRVAARKATLVAQGRTS